eukprot:3913290-Amphidinium_carterae.4
MMSCFYRPAVPFTLDPPLTPLCQAMRTHSAHRLSELCPNRLGPGHDIVTHTLLPMLTRVSDGIHPQHAQARLGAYLELL